MSKCSRCNGTGYANAARDMNMEDGPMMHRPIGVYRCDTCSGTGQTFDAAAVSQVMSALTNEDRTEIEWLRADNASRGPDGIHEAIWLAGKAAGRAEAAAIREWLDNNTTFCLAGTIPVLSSVSKRIWYHATDDESYLFSAVIDVALAAK